MPIAISNTGPVLATSTAATVTTVSFTPPANSVLLALVSYHDNTATTGFEQTVTTTGLTWTRLVRKSRSATSTGGATAGRAGVEIWFASQPTSAPRTVTATSTTADRRALRVLVFTGAETAFGGAVAASFTPDGLPSATVTTTRAGSMVVAAGADWTEVPGTEQFGAGQTSVDSVNYPGRYTLRNWRTANPVAAAGTAVTMNQTAPTNQEINLAVVEVREPAGGVSVLRQSTWQTAATVAVTRATTAATLQAVPVARATAWSVQALADDVYTDVYSDTYGTPGPVPIATSRATSWATRAAVPVTRATTWATVGQLVPVAISRTTTWNTAGTVKVVVTRSSSWATRIVVAGLPRSTAWSALARVPAVVRSSTWEVFDLPPTGATVTPGMRLRMYLPAGADQGLLHTPEGGDVAYPLDDVSSLRFSYPTRGARAGMLGQPLELAVEVTADGGVTWIEPPDSRFVYLIDDGDQLAQGESVNVQANGYVWRLSKAVVYSNNLLNNDGKRAFLMSEGSNVGVILKTLFGEAQTRGAMTGITHASFSTALDSAGQPWAFNITKYYSPGLDYLSVLQDFADTGLCDYRMVGRSLYVYNPNTTMAGDRTVGSSQVMLRNGRDLTEAPYTRTWEALADSALFLGDEVEYLYSNPAAVKPWGRQEVFISNGSVSDPGTMAAITQNVMSQRDDVRVQYTRGLNFASKANPRPFFHYMVGDYVWSTVDGSAPQSLRVRQVTLSVDEHGIVSGNVVLNDRFLESDVRAKKRVEGITNGAQSGPGTGTPPVVDEGGGTDNVSPAQVTGLSGSSAAYMTPGGFPAAQVTLTWNATILNANGTPADDIDHYEIYQRELGQSELVARYVDQTPATRHDLSPYVVGSNWTFNVLAVDRAGNRGAMSVGHNVGMAQDTVPPQAPTAPVITAKLSILSIYWDGLPATGTWPLDFDYIEVHTSVVNNFSPTDATLVDRLYGEGTSVVAGATYGVPVFAKFVAVDKNRPTPLKSVPSAQGSGTPAPLVGSDLGPGAITYEQLAFKDPGNIVPDGSLESEGYRTLLASRSAAAWTFTTADRFHGDWSATVNGTVGAGTARQLVLMSVADVQQIVATDKLFCRFSYKGTAGATGGVQLVAAWTDRAGTVTTTALPATLFNGTWQQVAAQLTAPANCQDFRIYMEVTAASTSGVFHVDAVEVRRTVATEFIEDAAITNALINNLAVNSAKIADLSVGKLSGGTLNAEVLVANRLTTSLSGDRVQLDSTGIRLFQAGSLNPTVHMDPSPGQLRIYNTTDASHTSTGHGMQFGASNSTNVIIDDNEIMARFNGSYGALNLNKEGGPVVMGGKMGGFSGADVGVFPSNDNHSVRIRAALFVENVSTADYRDEHPPFVVGWRGDQFVYMDKNSIGAGAAGDFADDFYINPRYADGDEHFKHVILASNSIAMRRVGSNNAYVRGWTGINSAVQFIDNEVRITNGATTAWADIHAAAFIQFSSEQRVKTEIVQFDAEAIMRGAPGRRWKYREGLTVHDDRTHYGPMLDDLPDDMVVESSDGKRGYDLAALAGVHHEALRLVIERLDRLEGYGPQH